MKAAIASLFLAGSGILVGAIVAVEASVSLYYVSQISGETQINGMTIGGLVLASSIAVVAVIKGGQYLIRLGGMLAKLQASLDAATALGPVVEELQKNVAENTAQIDALHRWRDTVDPIVIQWQTRTGINRKDVG